jgi:hypothetical protein
LAGFKYIFSSYAMLKYAFPNFDEEIAASILEWGMDK